jgi:hypothetical protein
MEGDGVLRTLETTYDLALVSRRTEIDGKEAEGVLHVGPGLEIRINTHCVAHDTFEKVVDERPRKITRRFGATSADTITSHPQNAAYGSEHQIKSPLDGRCVEFVWNDDRLDYDTTACDDSSIDGALLRGMNEDMDLQALLPRDPVAVGDHWQSVLGDDILRLGGTLGLDGYSEKPGSLTFRTSSKLDARYDRDIVDGGLRLAVLQITLDTTSVAKWTDGDNDNPNELEATTTLEGELKWDITGGRARSLTLEGGVKWTKQARSRDTVDGRLVDVVDIDRFEGTVSMDLQIVPK